MADIGIIGSGTWGTALGMLLDANGHRVTLWSALKDEVEALSVSRVHPNLPGIKLPKSMGITGDLEEAMREKRTARVGIGLGNIYQRIHSIYKEGDLKIYSSQGHCTVIQMRIPQEEAG